MGPAGGDPPGAGPVRVLSIDGGGIRGIIPALVLADLERRAGRPVAQLFDLVAGTSTGGILALALTQRADEGGPAHSAEKLVGLYEDEGPRIFSRSLARRIRSLDGFIDERYSADGLERALAEYLDDARLPDALIDVLVTSYDTAGREPVLLRRADDLLARDAARATAAAPTYFEPHALRVGGHQRSLIDGGVFALNPAMLAYAEVARTRPGSEVMVVSLGTGQLTRPLPFKEIRGWGQLEWARPILDVVFDGVADTIDLELSSLLGEHLYWRFQTALTEASDDLDDASAANLRALRRQGERLITEHAAQLDAVAGRLSLPV